MTFHEMLPTINGNPCLKECSPLKPVSTFAELCETDKKNESVTTMLYFHTTKEI